MMNITVEQGYFGIAENGYTIETGAAGPCIIVGIYDKVLKKAYLIHEDSAANDGQLKEFTEQVKSQSNRENLIVKVRGGAGSEAENDFDNVVLNREVVLTALKEFLHENQIDVVWRQSCMLIDTETGKFSFNF